MNSPDSADLQRIYAARFQTNIEYRRAVWRVLISDFFQRLVQPSDSVLDLGSGYGEFISQIDCAQKWAMDLNPDAPKRVGPGVSSSRHQRSVAMEPFISVVVTGSFTR